MKVKGQFQSSVEDGSLGGDASESLVTGRSPNEGSDNSQPIDGSYGDFLRLAKDAYETSTRYINSSLRLQWERNLRMFQSRHAPGSKYLTDSYKNRSKVYRPKTRSNIRTGEAQAATAYFTNSDVVKISPQDPDDPLQVASASVNQELLQYRLMSANSRVAIPWFQTVVGAFQDAQVYGFNTSKQWWQYRTAMPMRGAGGMPLSPRVIYDRPRCDLYPPENVRVDPACDWRDPVNSSPYVILMNPMYIGEIEENMRMADGPGGEPWLPIGRSALLAASGEQQYDPTRLQREDRREDPKRVEIAVPEYQTVWVHENFMRWQGEDWVFYTAGVYHILSRPKLVEDVYHHVRTGERPVVMGKCIIETHKAFSAGKPELSQGLQTEANDLANLRLDNVKLALMKRYKARRGRQIDLKSLVRNVPGSVTLMNELDDVEVMETRDVTQSSFMEQDRINVDFDEVLGNFSSGTVQTNRRMNETVGGMELLAGSANQIAELDLGVFTKTWAEPVLSQIVRLEQVYENDARILAIAGKKAAQYPHGFQIPAITEEMMIQDLTVSIAVGIGATDPQRQLMKFKMGAEIIGELLGDTVQMAMQPQEIVKEVFGILGYREGLRFFNFGDQDPRIQILMQHIQQLQQQLQSQSVPAQAKVQSSKMTGLARIISQGMANEGNLAAAKVKAGAAIAATQHSNFGNIKQEFMKQMLTRQTKLDAIQQEAALQPAAE